MFCYSSYSVDCIPTLVQFVGAVIVGHQVLRECRWFTDCQELIRHTHQDHVVGRLQELHASPSPGRKPGSSSRGGRHMVQALSLPAGNSLKCLKAQSKGYFYKEISQYLPIRINLFYSCDIKTLLLIDRFILGSLREKHKIGDHNNFKLDPTLHNWVSLGTLLHL